MTERTTIAKMTGSPSKQQEIDWLVEIANSVKPDWYLGSLLNPELVKWASHHIQNDYPPDIMDSLNFANNEKETVTAGLKKALTAAEEKNANFEIRIALVTERANNTADRLKEREATIERLAVEKDRLEQQINLIQQMRRREQEQLEMEIIKLKAKAYDMQEKLADCIRSTERQEE